LKDNTDVWEEYRPKGLIRTTLVTGVVTRAP